MQTMLKMSTGSENTSMQSQMPLSNGRRDDAIHSATMRCFKSTTLSTLVQL